MKNLTCRRGYGVFKGMSAEDKRLTKRLMGYWNRLRRDRPLPPWEKFNSGALEDIWGQCCVWRVEIMAGGRRSNQITYEYIGTGAQQAMGRDLTGEVFNSRLQRFYGARIVERIDEVIQDAIPLSDEGTFVNEMDKVVKYRSCLVPFGTAAGKVTHVVLGLSWRAF
jgi:hypothetical protein